MRKVLRSGVLMACSVLLWSAVAPRVSGGATRDDAVDVIAAGIAMPGVPRRNADIALVPVDQRFAAPLRIDPSVFPLAVRTVVLDAGHGGASRGTSVPFGLSEKEITLDVTQRLGRLLTEQGYQVVLTRSGDATVSLQKRAQIANEAEGDIFVSIHVNWIEEREARGVETYFLGTTDDPYLTRLAANENRDSGYSLADMRSMLDRIYADVRQDQSRGLAQSVQQALYSAMHATNPAVGNRGVKTAPFVVLTATQMPAILTEVSCLSNDEEAALLHDGGYRQAIANALFDGLRAYADARIHSQPVKKGTLS